MVMLMILAVLESFEILLLLLTFSSTIEKIWVYWKLEWEVGCQTCCLVRSKTYLNFRCVVRLFCSAQGESFVNRSYLWCWPDYCKCDNHIRIRILCCFINPALAAWPLILCLRVGVGGGLLFALMHFSSMSIAIALVCKYPQADFTEWAFFVSVHFHLSVRSCWGEFPFQVPL